MDSRTGLDYIVENKDYVSKLGTALDSDNYTVKKQVFDLLSALCAHSPEGYNRAFETLEHYMVSMLLCGFAILTYNRVGLHSDRISFIRKDTVLLSLSWPCHP